MSRAAVPDPDQDFLPTDVHIAGVLLHARPGSLERVRSALKSFPEVEVFQASEDGRLVLVVEAHSSRAVMTLLESMRDLDGVLGVSLVYQHTESAEALQEEMDP